MSAVAVYPGDYLQYEVYGEATSDPRIMELMDQAVPVVSAIITREYAVEQDVQLAFTVQTVYKFRSREIYGMVYQDARQAQRKLNKEERLYKPLWLAEGYGQRYGYTLLTAAAAIRCAVVKENSNPDTLVRTHGNSHPAGKLKEVYGLLKEGVSLEDVIKFCTGF